MQQDQILLIVLGVVVAANVVLVASIPLRARGIRRSTDVEHIESGRSVGRDAPVAQPPAGEPTGPPVGPSGRGDPPHDEDARTAAAIEAFVAGVSTGSAGRGRSLAPFELASRRRDTVTAAAPEATAVPGTPVGLADSATWDRTVRQESARAARFGRRVAVVIAELPRLDGIADRFGGDVAEKVVAETARFLMTEGRAADRIAWLGDARFGVLLVEADEVGARIYVDRVRAAADSWLESAGLSIRLSIGWASTTEGGDVAAAATSARQRMHESTHGRFPAPTLRSVGNS